MGQMLPIFDALMQNGNSMMGSNPMMSMFGGQQQAPQQSLSEIFQAMQPQQPEPQQAPQAPWMQGMTPEQMAAIQRFNGYGGRR